MTITITKLYEILSAKIGRPEAEMLTGYVEEKIADKFAKQKSSIVSEIKLEIEKLRTDIEKSGRGQMWAMLALFIPLYITMTIALTNLLKH